MSIFGNIMHAIFGSSSAAAAKPGTSAAVDSSVAAKPITNAEVQAQIAKIPNASKYNWKVSIVDLMKLLNLDSSLDARKQLAKELGYTGELTGSAEMNVWLHKQVMTKLAESGGQVPDSLKRA